MVRVLVIFDMDGTLLADAGGGTGLYVEAHRFAFKKALGIDIEENFSFKKYTGWLASQTLSDMAQSRGVNEKKIHDHLPRLYNFTYQYLKDNEDELKVTVLNGVIDLLTLLKNNNIYLAIATGNIRDVAILKLKKAGLKDFFVMNDKFMGEFGSEENNRADIIRSVKKKMDNMIGSSIAYEHIFVVGDSDSDIKAGIAVGAKTIGVATGIMSEHTLRQHGASITFPNFASAQNREKFLQFVTSL